eukprot:GFYU01005296.1.p1 GENE.GFYU01005296.1~~GFYU01005296.1.p1  ORF type:complete len:131 (-),score=16.85 GFYU01005296.1:31-423(-)
MPGALEKDWYVEQGIWPGDDVKESNLTNNQYVSQTLHALETIRGRCEEKGSKLEIQYVRYGYDQHHRVIPLTCSRCGVGKDDRNNEYKDEEAYERFKIDVHNTADFDIWRVFLSCRSCGMTWSFEETDPM